MDLAPIHAQSSIPSVSQLDFLTGNWKFSNEWGDMDEVWSKPSGNCIMCSYRCVKNGKIVFYEFVVIEQTSKDSVPVMKLRHFSPGSIGWEDKNNPYLYPLATLTKNKAVFERPDRKTILTYERLSENQLKVILEQEKDGKMSTTEFLFTRQ
jgi:hypothetical protein